MYPSSTWGQNLRGTTLLGQPCGSPCPAAASRFGQAQPVIPAATTNGQRAAISSHWGLCQVHGHLYFGLVIRDGGTMKAGGQALFG